MHPPVDRLRETSARPIECQQVIFPEWDSGTGGGRVSGKFGNERDVSLLLSPRRYGAAGLDGAGGFGLCKRLAGGAETHETTDENAGAGCGADDHGGS